MGSGNLVERAYFPPAPALDETRSPSCDLSGLVAGDSAICGRLAALILRLRPAGLRFEEFRSPVKRGGLGLRFSNRSGLRPAAIGICGHKLKFCSHSGIGCDFSAG